jgi:hypothetical protein
MIPTTKYFKDWADSTGKTLRELKAIWEKTLKEVQFDEMYNPSKYTHLRSSDRGLSLEVANRMDALLAAPAEEPEMEPEVPVETEQLQELGDVTVPDLTEAPPAETTPDELPAPLAELDYEETLQPGAAPPETAGDVNRGE